jgi:hypothetical protein
MRTTPAVRWVLCLAALLSLSAAFGLHPEPDAANGQLPGSGFSRTRLQAPAHGCIACLAHGAALPSALAAILTLGAPSGPASLSVSRGSADHLCVERLSGRSPPARS